MTHWFEKVLNLLLWSVLVYEALDFQVSPRLLINLFYIFIVLTFIAVKLTQIPFQELASYTIIGVYSYFSNIAIFLPNMDDIGVVNTPENFMDEDINSLQMFGVILLFSCDGYRSFIIWISCVLVLSYAIHKANQQEENGASSERNESSRLFHMIIVTWLLLTLLYTFSVLNSLYSAVLILLSSDTFWKNLSLRFEHFTLFLNVAWQIYVFRVVIFSLTVFNIYLNIYLNSSSSFKLTAIAVIVLFKFYYDSTVKILEMFYRKVRISAHSHPVPIGQLQRHSDPCPVCLSPMISPNITRCKHLFHESCLDLCLQRQPSCPVCRQLLIK
ncbi:protein TRC8 homolog [Mytilus californianus]|uniref:protein TRC8 homolog n=1 Tax=Mytilus californianus TaxID=6549 RepID=UPI002245F098|nr:protein TRC8 homolog [Mytilus californianus]